MDNFHRRPILFHALTPNRMNRLIPTMTAAAALVGLGVFVVFLF